MNRRNGLRDYDEVQRPMVGQMLEARGEDGERLSRQAARYVFKRVAKAHRGGQAEGRVS